MLSLCCDEQIGCNSFIQASTLRATLVLCPGRCGTTLVGAMPSFQSFLPPHPFFCPPLFKQYGWISDAPRLHHKT